MADFDIDAGGGTGSTWLDTAARTDFQGASVLLVEDDPDIRELMSTLLQLAGFSPTTCGTAEMALEQLREQQFDLVLTDYMLPSRTGGWLLQQALREGLIEGTPVIVLTAHPDPPDVRGFEIIRKPCDLDELVSRIRQRLDSSSGAPRVAHGASRPRASSHDGGKPHRGTVELILYVSAHSPKTASAIRNIKEAIARVAPDRVSLTICDLSKNPNDGTADRIEITPTLVKRSPGPRTFIVGHITNPDVVAELLESCDDA